VSETNTGQKHALLELISTGYGTITGELHPPPRQGNARLTSSTAPLNIIDRPVSPSPSPSPVAKSLGRPIPRGGLPQHVRVKRGHGSARMKKSCVIPPC